MIDFNRENYADYLYGPLTRYYTKLIDANTVPGKKLYFFAFLCSIILALILAACNYFFGLLFIVALFFFVPFLRSLDSTEARKDKIAKLQLLMCEAILLIGLILHAWQEPSILPVGLLALFGFLLIPHFATETGSRFYILNFDLRMTLLMVSLAINLGILLLFCYAVLFNLQIIWKMIQFEHTRN